jgi:hypothetical protein
VRKSGARVRVAARLIRAENGYVMWSETYDRPFDDLIMVQDDIASEVTKALKASIEEKPATDTESEYLTAVSPGKNGIGVKRERHYPFAPRTNASSL